MRERFDAVTYWIAHHGAAFLVSVFGVFAFAGLVGTVSIMPPPSVAVTSEQAYISESSRDVGETPKAVATRRDGSKVFVDGVYVEGDAVTLYLNESGGVVNVSRAEYWTVIVAFAIIAGGSGLIPGMFVLYSAQDSNAARRHARQRVFFGV